MFPITSTSIKIVSVSIPPLRLLSLTFALAACSPQPQLLQPGSAHEPTSEPRLEKRPASARETARADSDAGALTDAGPLARESAPGSTKGTIACGRTRCKAGQQKCISEPDWHCVPVADEQDEGAILACDDASDCADGKACCWSFASAAEYWLCTDRSGAESDCQLERCVEGDGAPCPDGQVCKGGACRASQAGRATCGARRCPEQRPYCAWKGGKGECVDAERAEQLDPVFDRKSSLLACTRPSDCGSGENCCTSMLGPQRTHCATNCDLTNMMQLCAKDSDCPELVPNEGAPAIHMKCAPAARDPELRIALPPGTAHCKAP